MESGVHPWAQNTPLASGWALCLLLSVMGRKLHVHAINFLLPETGDNGLASYHHHGMRHCNISGCRMDQWVMWFPGDGQWVSITARFWEGTSQDYLVPAFTASTRENWNKAFSISVNALQCAG